ncbi:MAG: flagellar motor protein MotB [Desulfovibrio sp.]|jgi:chemotaxis protein MotB|nr:flagellar motor protein MotB [Desulfovibrio sp.]
MAKKVIIVKKPAEEGPKDEGLPPWMATFADMVTLLLCFFVLLLSFAEQDVQKFRDVLGSLRDAFGVAVVRTKSTELALETSSETEVSQAPTSTSEQILNGVVVRIRSILEKSPELKRASGVRVDREGVLFDVRSGALFEPGSAQLSPEARQALDSVILVLKEYPLNLVVRGHTDNRPITTGRYASNWELSAARAANALAYIVEVGGIPVNRVKAVGYAHTRPVADNASVEGRLKNQRVEFFFHQPEKENW